MLGVSVSQLVEFQFSSQLAEIPDIAPWMCALVAESHSYAMLVQDRHRVMTPNF